MPPSLCLSDPTLLCLVMEVVLGSCRCRGAGTAGSVPQVGLSPVHEYTLTALHIPGGVLYTLLFLLRFSPHPQGSAFSGLALVALTATVYGYGHETGHKGGSPNPNPHDLVAQPTAGVMERWRQPAWRDGGTHQHVWLSRRF